MNWWRSTLTLTSDEVHDQSFYRGGSGTVSQLSSNYTSDKCTLIIQLKKSHRGKKKTLKQRWRLRAQESALLIKHKWSLMWTIKERIILYLCQVYHRVGTVYPLSLSLSSLPTSWPRMISKWESSYYNETLPLGAYSHTPLRNGKQKKKKKKTMNTRMKEYFSRSIGPWQVGLTHTNPQLLVYPSNIHWKFLIQWRYLGVCSTHLQLYC